MFQNRSLYNIAIIHLQKEINFQKCITRLFGAKIQKFKTISQCFKIAQKVSFYNIGIIHLQKEIDYQKCILPILPIFGAKIQIFKTMSKCFKIAQKVSFFNIAIIHLQKKKYIFSKVHFAHFWHENSNI